MTVTETWRGPALKAVRADDAEALRHLCAEQDARLQTVRANRAWDWLGDVPGWEICPAAMYGTIAFLALVPSAIVTAGFTRGPVLWVLCALAVLTILPQLLRIQPARRRAMARYRRAALVPAAVIAAEPELCDSKNEMSRGVWALVMTDGPTPESLRELVAGAQALRRMLEGKTKPPAELAPFVASVRADVDARRADGSRTPVPGSMGPRLEYARLHVSPNYLPGDRLCSQLLFVFRDPADGGPDSMRVLQPTLWGEGVSELCAAFPWEAA